MRRIVDGHAVAALGIVAAVSACGLATPRTDPDLDAAADTRDAGTDAARVDAFTPPDAGTDAARACVPTPEICNGRDDDCDGVADEEPEASTWCGARCGIDACPSARPMGPLSGALLTSRRPTFRWELSGGADAGRLELCRDRACTDVLTTLDGLTAAAPTEDLPRGVVFWRVVPLRDGVALPAVRAPWVARVPSVGHAVDGATGIVDDIDADGHGDLLLTRWVDERRRDREVVLVRGSPAGLSEPIGLPLTPSVTVVADFDGDGCSDVLSREREYALWDGASGLVGPPRVLSLSASYGAASAGDVDADGRIDLLVETDTGVGIARGDATGALAVSLDVPVPPYGESFGNGTYPIGDLDADGAADFVAAQDCIHGGLAGGGPCPMDRTLWLLRGTALGIATPRAWSVAPLSGVFGDGSIDTAIPFAAAGDVDGDGRLDIAATDVYSVAITLASPYGDPASPLVLLQRDATLDRDASRTLDAERVIGWVGPACDLDGDGAGDLVLVTGRYGPTFLRRGGPDGPGPEAIPLSSMTAFASRCLGDDDGDGFSDLAVLLYDVRDTTGQVELHVFRGAPGGIEPEPAQVLHVGRNAHFPG